MSMTPVKRKILEVLWIAGEPLKLIDIAKKTGSSVSSSKVHVLELIRGRYLSEPKKDYYAVTSTGKEAIGFPRIDRKRALSILSSVPLERAFHFYTGIGRYIGVFANSLSDFCEKIQEIDAKSNEFHMSRKDFDLWFDGLGDKELARRMRLIRDMHLSGNSLRKKLYETVKSRHEELMSLSRRAVKRVETHPRGR